MTCYPWKECKPDSKGQLEKIYKIAHITHKRNMVTIDAVGYHYHFEPKQKYGKCGYEVTDGSPLGESYRCVLDHKTPTTETRYTKVTDKELLLPDGYYVWWGPSNVTSSMYGTEKLTTSFKSALGKFKWFHKDPDEPDPPDVYLRVGGTLRYKKEICYVIVIHTDNGASNEIEKLPPLRNNAHFKLNGFLDVRGRVVNWETVPEFIPGQFEGGCKDILAFAFYFDDCESHFCLDKPKVEWSQVRHDRCLRSFKVKPEFRPDPDRWWYCPEDERLPNKSQEELEDTN